MRYRYYWPSIRYRCGVYDETFSTSSPTNTMQEAKDASAVWAEDFHILHAWIDVYTIDDDGKKHRRKVTLF